MADGHADPPGTERVRLQGEECGRQRRLALRLPRKGTAHREHRHALRLHATVQGTGSPLREVCLARAGDSRLPLQPVRRTGARLHPGDTPVLHGQLRHPLPAVRQDRGQRIRSASPLHLSEVAESLRRLRHQRQDRKVHGRDDAKAGCRLRQECRHQVELHEVSRLWRRPGGKTLRADRQARRRGG